MEQKKHGKKWLLWAILALTAAILAVLPVLASRRELPSGVQASIRSAQAVRRDVDTLLIGGGQLESSGVYNLKIPENVKIKEFLVGNGDTVQEGEAIARVDSVSVMTAITEVQETLQELAGQINKADSADTTGTINAQPGGRVKKIYAQAGDSVEDVMLRYGALAVISLDDVMAVRLEAETALRTGDKVLVTIDGEQVTGRVQSNVGGELIITVEDALYEIGARAAVSDRDGQEIGAGALYVFNAWNAAAYSGTISSVNVREGQSISENRSLFTVKESGKAPEYQQAIDKRQKYEALMQELFAMYRSGVLTAPCDGIVSGIDTDGAYMLLAEEGGFSLTLLTDVQYEIEIITQSLPAGVTGEPYTAFLQAARGEEPAEGTWAAAGLPAGLRLDEASGLISGTPTAPGSFPITVSFTVDGETYCTAELMLTISKKPEPEKPQYFGYPAQVTAVGGDVIRVKQTEYAYTISDPEHLPSISADTSAMTMEATYSGQVIANGNFALGDLVLLVLDGDGTLVKAVKLTGNGPGENPEEMPEGGPTSGGFGGGAGGFGGAAAEEDDGLYSLDKVTVATVTSQEQMTVSISVDELDITKIYLGQKALISMNAFAEDPVEAVVRKIANSGENAGGNSKFTVELELQKSSRMLPGMNATAAFTLDTEEQALCIPAAAVYELDGNTVVYTAYDEKTETLGDPIAVSIGSADADFVQILSGLQDGQTVYYETYEAGFLPSIL